MNEDAFDRALFVELGGRDDDGNCPTCGGSGEVIVCVDDMCHGTGECIHGGNVPCPDCCGYGEAPR